MRLATIWHENRPRLAVLAEDGSLVLAEPALSDVGVGLAQHGVGLLDRVESTRRRGGSGLDPDAVTWLPPVTRPSKVLCVALNNSANPGRILSGPEHPALFPKPPSSLVGHRQPIRLRPAYGVVHPEPELAVVIGTGGTDISQARAMDHVLGYAVFNDLTSPTMRTEDTFHYRAVHGDADAPGGVAHVESWVTYPARYKGSDTFGPFGPVVVTADEVPDPHALAIRCTHQGALVTSDTTANLRFSVAEVIAFTSGYLTLQPGDVLAMGTALAPAASGRAVQSIDLNTLGGPVEVSIERVGSLVNPVTWR